MTPKGFAEMSLHQGKIDDPQSVLPSSCRNEMQDELREDSSDKHFEYVYKRDTFKSRLSMVR